MTEVLQIVIGLIAAIAGVSFYIDHRRGKLNRLEEEAQEAAVKASIAKKDLEYLEKKAVKRRENVKQAMDDYFTKYPTAPDGDRPGDSF